MEHLELLAPTLMLILNMLRTPAPLPPDFPLPAMEQTIEAAEQVVELAEAAPDAEAVEAAARPPEAAGETGVAADLAEIAAFPAMEQARETAPDTEALETAAQSPEPAEETGVAVEQTVELAEQPNTEAMELAEAAPDTEVVEAAARPPEPAAEPPESRPPDRAKKPRREWPAVVVFTEGFTGSYLTRIILQENRSNFVFEDYLAGLFFNVKTTPFKRVNIMARLSAYYPLLFYFNDVPQPAATPIHYGADLFLGPVFEPTLRNLIRFDLSPGLHLFFENTDRWNYLHLGAAALAGIELPLSTRWTVYLDGLASFDYGNLGNNRTMEPYDIVYQYQVGIGVRYSKKTPNIRPWIKPRQKR